MAIISRDLLLAFNLRGRDIVQSLGENHIRFGPIYHVRFYPDPPVLDIDCDWVAEQIGSGPRQKKEGRGRFIALDLTNAKFYVDDGEFTVQLAAGTIFKIRRPYESMSYDR